MKPAPPGAEYRSYWVKSAAHEPRQPLAADAECDVVVVGGGIVGVSAALELTRAGAGVVLVEARQIGSGATGYTTAKLSSLHGLTYSRLTRRHGEATARAYGEANQAGLERIDREVDELAIECDFRRKPNYTYAAGESGRDEVAAEAEDAARLGLPASAVAAVPELPFDAHGAVRFDEQAEFHPLRYLEALAEAAADAGCRIHEQTRVVSVDQGDPCRVLTEAGAVLTCGHVVVATHLPILDRGLYFARTHPERSYVLLAQLDGEPPPGMYLSDESPAHSLRSVPTEEGELLMVGGESHKAGQSDAVERYAALERWARERFDIVAVEHRWATQDNMPADGLPMIGRLWPFSDRLLTATALRKWGLAIGAEAGAILTDLVLGRENEWAQAFDPIRLGPPQTALELAKENANVAVHFAGDRITKRGNPRCTHLGCLLDWNSAERTWDCPCHGSRFAEDGEVLEGPAVNPLSLD